MIKAIIFDWFGVCTVENWSNCIVRSLSGKVNCDEEKIKSEFKKLLQPFARDEISSEEFLGKFIFSLDSSKNPGDFKFLFDNIPELNLSLFEAIKKLKENYKVYLLSNNFGPIFPKYQKMIPLETYFDHLFLSHEMKISKVDEKMWISVLTKINCKPREVLFIDNTEKYLEVAKNLGINTCLFKSTEQTLEDLKKYKISLN